jgi:hypothetical protein
MNILITSAGRRGYIVEYFKKALKGNGEVHVGNSSPFSTAFAYADRTVITPLIYSEEYIPFLLSYCKKYSITMLISLFDIDLMILAQNKKKFEEEGICVIVSNSEVIRRCNDKWETYLFCKSENITTPRTYIDLQKAKNELKTGNLQFPVIIKPRWGMGSLQIYSADNLEELETLYKKCKRDIRKTYLKYESDADIENSVLIQERMVGQEYGIDIINDLQGNFQRAIAKKKYGLRAGETDCAEIIKNKEMDEFSEHLAKILGHIGNLDVDAFVSNGKIYLLEMNARFGGGYPFSYLAGADLPSAIIRWVSGEKLNGELEGVRYGKIMHKDIRFVDLTPFILEGKNETV